MGAILFKKLRKYLICLKKLLKSKIKYDKLIYNNLLLIMFKFQRLWELFLAILGS